MMDDTVQSPDAGYFGEFSVPVPPPGRGAQKNAAGQMSLRWYRRHFGDAYYQALKGWERMMRNTPAVEGPTVPQSEVEDARIAS